MMKKLLLTLILFLPLTLQAEDMTSRLWHKHEIRVGYGDCMYETMVWHNSPTYFTLEQTYDYQYTGHIFGEYHHRPNAWFSYGGQVDYQQVFWIRQELNEGGEFDFIDCNFVDVSLIPTIRFTFYWSDWVNLYCGLGAGLLINGGTERDYKGRLIACAPVLDLSLLGVSVGRDIVFGTFEIGGLFSLSDANTIYMIGSRIFSASIGVRF